MAIIKVYTDLSQSKKLAEILGFESADMVYCAIHNIGQEIYHCNVPIFAYASHKDIPCWSLGALLNLIPDSIYENTDDFAQLEITKRSLGYHDINDNIVIGTLADNLVDACVGMILKLHERKIL